MKKEIDDLIVAIDETEWAILDDSLNVTEDVKGSLNSTHPFMLQFLEEESKELCPITFWFCNNWYSN